MEKWFKLTAVLYLLFEITFLFGQCQVGESAFRPGEKITYVIAYNWGIIWVNAGEAYFKVDTIIFNNKTAFRFEAFGTSYQYYDWIYKVRDLYQSYLDPGPFQPLWFHRKTYEGGDEVYNDYIFDPEKRQIFVDVRRLSENQILDTLPLDACRLDVLSAVYFARNLNYDVYKPGDKIEVRILIDNEFYETYIHYLGKEIIQNRSGKKYKCHKMSALLIEGTIFKGGEDLVVWVTDDKNRIPIMAEAKILIGSVKAYLIGYEGLKFEMEAEVGDIR